mmetsp:Transcript_19670/g.38452  ORF Transcript_19670/g.38452 Transcript_19670/m.38452 type:complete len:201 (-) Transcript_19670:1525-2127(-)
MLRVLRKYLLRFATTLRMVKHVPRARVLYKNFLTVTIMMTRITCITRKTKMRMRMVVTRLSDLSHRLRHRDPQHRHLRDRGFRHHHLRIPVHFLEMLWKMILKRMEIPMTSIRTQKIMIKVSKQGLEFSLLQGNERTVGANLHGVGDLRSSRMKRSKHSGKQRKLKNALKTESLRKRKSSRALYVQHWASPSTTYASHLV